MNPDRIPPPLPTAPGSATTLAGKGAPASAVLAGLSSALQSAGVAPSPKVSQDSPSPAQMLGADATGGPEGRVTLATPLRAHILSLIDTYLDRLHLERNRSAFTLRNYRSDLLHFFGWWEQAESTDPLMVTRPLFRRYLAALDADGAARGSIARRVSTIHTFYRFLVREGLLESDPLRELRPPKKAQTLPHILTEGSVAALLDAPDLETDAGVRDRAILELLYGAGLRVRELTGLDTADLDLHEMTVRVTGKGNKQRIAMFGEPAERALRLYLKTVRLRVGRSTRQGALFLNKAGGRLSVRAVELLVRRYALAAGIDARAYPHLLRHSFATHMLDGGADVRIVQELLGHSSAATTQIYTHVTEQRQRQTYTDAFYGQWQPRKGKAQREKGKEEGD